jgi:chaperonin cofactor prefoldin
MEWYWWLLIFMAFGYLIDRSYIKRTNNLEERIDELETKIEELQDRIDDLESRLED